MNWQTKHVTGKIAAGLLEARTSTSRIRRHSSALLLLIVFGVEAGLAIFIMRDLLIAEVEVQRMYTGSVRGLRRIGELQYESQETRRASLYALTTNDGNLQVDYADQSREADRQVKEGISEYLAQARMPREIEVGRRLANDWDAYLKIRDDVLSLILESSTKEAVSVDLTSGVPLFDRVRQDLEQIKRLYDEQASRQLVAAAGSSRRSQVKVIDGLGFALLFGSVAIWAIQKSKTRATLELAKLQMDFVASVSHELRTPITAILSAGENVRDGLVDGREGLVEQASIIVNQADQLADLVDQVLRFAATTRGKPRYTLRPLQVSKIFECALRNTAGLLQKSGFIVEQQIQQALPYVVGDLSAVSQCLRNLIENAVRYSDKDRWIGLSAKIEESARGKEVQISVQDHGRGISSSELPLIFEPFYRSPWVVAAQIHGSGLGLSIAKGNAEALRGRLSVISEVGVGSTFTLHLLVAEEDCQLASVTSANDLGIGI